MGIVDRIGRVIKVARGEDNKAADTLREYVARVEVESARWERIAKENHDIIVSVLKERDQWSSMWQQHGREHAVAQSVMTEIIERAYKEIALLVSITNEERRKEGLPEIASGFAAQLDQAKKIAADYQKSLDSASAKVTPVDALAEREAVQQRNPAP